MNAVALIERGLRNDAVEKERIERHIILLGEFAIDRVEARSIVGPRLGGASIPAGSTFMFRSAEAAQNVVEVRPWSLWDQSRARHHWRRVQRSPRRCRRGSTNPCGRVRLTPYRPKHRRSTPQQRNLWLSAPVPFDRKCLTRRQAITGGERIPQHGELHDAPLRMSLLGLARLRTRPPKRL